MNNFSLVVSAITSLAYIYGLVGLVPTEHKKH